MKVISIAICFLFLVNIATTQDYRFGIGLTYQPYFYKNYNKSDWNNLPQSYPVMHNNFNGKAFGITFQKPISNLISVKSSILYSSESQDHSISSIIILNSVTHDTVRYYGTQVSTKFKHLKLPIQLCASHELSYQSGLFVRLDAGLQISYLTDYISTYDSYKFNENTKTFDYDFVINHISQRPNLVEQSIWRDSQMEYEQITSESPYIFTKFMIGAIFDFVIEKVISEEFAVGIGGVISYDFNNSEKFPYWMFSGMGGIADHNRKSSHNLSYGLQFNLRYLFQ